MKVDILYRGPLESCNYGCDYCPFAKKEESAAAQARDQAALRRFLGWIRARPAGDRIGVLFTPWGEALVRPWYRDALAELTHLETVRRAAIQTNLSVPLDWVDGCVAERLGVWATYHPEWTDRRRFVRRIRSLHERGASVSAGIVGFARFSSELEALRAELPPEVYLWINAPKRYESFDRESVARLEQIDPLFGYNTQYHRSRGERCYTGNDVVSVDGEGNIRRCHFVDRILGNLYRDELHTLLADRPCPAKTCGCHLGYVHLEHLGLRARFGEGILERVPTPPRSDARTQCARSE